MKEGRIEEGEVHERDSEDEWLMKALDRGKYKEGFEIW